MNARAIKRAGAAVASVAILLPALAGCGSSGNDKSSAAQSGTSTFPQTSEPSNLNPADFTTNIDNAYWPMPAGRVWHIHVTNPQGESLQETITAENRTKKMADGVTARVVRDIVYDHGKPSEFTDDFYAQDAQGNICYFGEETTSIDLKTGKRDSSGSFEAGKNGADAGIAMPAHPYAGETYREEYYKGHAEDRSTVIALNQQVEAPAGHFTGAVLTDDHSPLEPTVSEYKLYAKGVGPVVAVSVSGEAEREDLVSYTH